MQDGVSQFKAIGKDLASFTRGRNDPEASFAEQLAGRALPFTNIQTVSTTRINSLAITYTVPAAVARRVGARNLRVAVQGRNLGLWTNYRGLDPNVNAISQGNGLIDRATLPLPRTWQVRINASY